MTQLRPRGKQRPPTAPRRPSERNRESASPRREIPSVRREEEKRHGPRRTLRLPQRADALAAPRDRAFDALLSGAASERLVLAASSDERGKGGYQLGWGSRSTSPPSACVATLE